MNNLLVEVPLDKTFTKVEEDEKMEVDVKEEDSESSESEDSESEDSESSEDSEDSDYEPE